MELLLRADASPLIGTGHVMRELALAQAWRAQGGGARFACAQLGGALAERVHAEGFALEAVRAAPGGAEDARATVRLARAQGARWVAVDGYHFGPAYQSHLRAAGLRVLLVDDEARASAFEADVLLNQNLHASERDYGPKAGGARLLLGSQFALLRREFVEAPRPAAEAPERARRVLVTLGGADPDNATERVLRALLALHDSELEIVCLIGAANPHAERLRALAAPPRLVLLEAVSDVPRWMRWAELAVSAAGSTSWEFCYMGVPVLALVLADNQAPIARSLAERGAAVSLGRASQTDETRIARAVAELIPDGACRSALARQARALVDGRGAERVARAMREAA